MNQALLFEHFSSIGDVPDALPCLRRFILDLAVRGRLVEQDPRDEPATELFNRILAEKARQVRAGIAEERSILRHMEKAKEPFSIPKTWAWACVGDVFNYDAGIKRDPRQLDPDRWLLELEDIEKDTSKVVSRLKVKDRDSLSTKSEFVVGDILYGKLRPYLNKVVVANEPGYSTTEIVAIRPFVPVCSSYCALAFRRPDFVEYVERCGRGTKMPRLRTPDAIVAPFPLPPIAEQRRIVTKVDELMALCDRLESTQKEREKRREQLTAASIHYLSNGTDAEAFREHACFYLDHFLQLTLRPGQIHGLRQAILNLAVRGRLLEYDPRGCELKGPTSLNMLLPSSWSVDPLSNVCSEIVDCPHSTPKWTAKGYICVRTNQFRPGSLDLSNSRHVSKETYLDRIQRLKPKADDILYSREGGILGVACRVPPSVELCLGQRMMLIRPDASIDPVFLEMVLNSPLISQIAKQKTTGGAAPRINVATVKAYPIPLPPLPDQRRIVAKVQKLMALCDRLEATLTVTREESTHLLEAVLYHALNTVEPAILGAISQPSVANA